MIQISEHRFQRKFGDCKNAHGIGIWYDSKPGGFYSGWTARLIVKDDWILYGYSKDSLHEAMNQLRYQMSVVELWINMPVIFHRRSFQHKNSVSRHFDSDFIGSDGLNRWWCHRTLIIEKTDEYNFFQYRSRMETAGRNCRGQWQPRDDPVEFTVMGRSIKDIKVVLKEMEKIFKRT
jgi:hypothetical protein